MTESRIKKHPILSIDRHYSTVSFTFNGKKLKAKEGEMISSALFAHGIHIFGRHNKDQSPQGMFCANGQCSQCLVIGMVRWCRCCFSSVLWKSWMRS